MALFFCQAGIDAVIPPAQPNATERERAGLRGPVKSCIEESIYPKTLHCDQGTAWTACEYSIDGRLLSYQVTNPDGSKWTITQTYGDDCRLARVITSRSSGEPDVESLLTYDDAGRVVSITESPQKGCHIGFLYDPDGLKTATQTFDPETLGRARKTAVAGSLWHAAIHSGVGVPNGGTVKTIYNEKSRPTESQILAADGQLITRFVCRYDAGGNLLEEKTFTENPAQLLLDQMLSSGQVPALTPEQIQEMKKQLIAKMEEALHVKFGDGQPSAESSYTYDERGLTSTIRRRNHLAETFIATEHNEHGDVIEWRQTADFGPKMPAGPKRDSVVRYSYKYDSYGNWTQQTATYPGQAGQADEPGPVVNRKFVYY